MLAFLSTPSARRATRARSSMHSPSQFLSTPSARRATSSPIKFHAHRGFLSTPSARRATAGEALRVSGVVISIHALREEGDRCSPCPRSDRLCYFYPRPPRGGRRTGAATSCHSGQFLSTPSARRATFKPEQSSVLQGLFLSTPSARRATPAAASASMTRSFLSTPSARRATVATLLRIAKAQNISIHALREEGDVGGGQFYATTDQFLSTPSARRATAMAHRRSGHRRDFYPRPPRGGRRSSPIKFHAHRGFLSTPSARRATFAQGHVTSTKCISIHALREEGDSSAGTNGASF